MMRSRRIRDGATGLAAVFALLVIVVGVPIALVRFVGWPLPASVPRLDAIGAALRYGQIAPGTLLKTLAVIIWVTWGLMTAGILVELLALARGTVARTLPTIGGLQQLAARLLTAAMLLSTLTARPAAAAAPAATAPAVMMTPAIEPSAPSDVRDQDDASTWVVQRHDSLWAIAERALGDGHRWREIRDLNVGRTQPGGGSLRAGDTMIHPGWVLHLPVDVTAGRTPQTQVEVQRGDHLWGLAEAHLGDGARWRQLYTRNAGAPQPDGERLTRPDMIRPGWVLKLPGRHAPHHAGDGRDGEPDDRRGRHAPHDAQQPPGGPGQPPIAPLPITPETLFSSRDRQAQRPASASDATPEPPVVAASASHAEQQRDIVPIAGIALLAAGLLAALARRRRNWLRRRQAGSALEPIDPEAAELERWLRAMADHDLSHRVDRVLRLLSEHFAAHDAAPAILALELGERVSLLLAAADTSPPPGITASDDGCTWILDAELEVAAPLDIERAPLIPALVGCGHRPTGELVALNLLHAGVLDVSGPAHHVEKALTSWTAELASSGAAAGVELIVVGPHHHLIEEFTRVTIADDAHAAVGRIDRLLGLDGHAAHAVVLSAEPATGPAWSTLRTRAEQDPRLALVATGDQAADHRLLVDGDRVRLDPPGLELTVPEWLTPQTWDRYGDLLRQPVRQQQSDLVPSPLLTAPLDSRLAQLATLDADDDTEPARMVGVLGPLRIDGVSTPAPLVGDLLAYLAVHNEGVSIETISAHLGDDARAAVENAQALIAVDGDGHHRLADGVGSDIGRFRVLTRRLDHQAPASQASHMQAALGLVRGLPFCDSGGWVHAEGLVTATTALICDVAHRLAALVMTFGDLDRATWAVDQGLLANPECELLYRDRMRIADARGDHVALDAIMHELRTRTGADDGWVTPETLQLYERLKRSTTITAAPTDQRDAS